MIVGVSYLSDIVQLCRYKSICVLIGGGFMRFNIGEQIGETGGFGKVYKCVNENGQLFACKILQDISDMGVQRFEREIRLLTRLNHPNVMKLITYSISEKQKLYVMPLYSGSCKSMIPTIVGDTYAQYCVLNAIMNGIAYLHSEGVIHRDLKPENILCNNVTDVVITDFGLGIQMDSDSTTLTCGLNFGTYRYCSPEQLSNMHTVDYRTDIYALGRIIEDVVTNFGSVSIPDNSMRYIIDKCTKQNKNDRFEKIEEVKYILDAYYSRLFGLQQNASVDEMLLKLERNLVEDREIIDIANQITRETDRARIEMFFSKISVVDYQYLENDSLTLAKGLVEQLCDYWEETGWTFTYIDSIADLGVKIYNMSNAPDVKALILYTIMDLAIHYNRWYAMGQVKILFNDVMSNIPVQSDLAMRMRKKKLRIFNIFDSENQLPAMIREIYQ